MSYLKGVKEEVMEPEKGEGVVDLEAADESSNKVGRLL